MKKIELYTDKENCCGCGACANVCPKEAISMKYDEIGFIYPHIDESKCIACGKCVSTCSFLHHEKINATSEPNVYAAAAKDKDVLRKSTSGGIFAEAAKWVISQGGVVFGAAWNRDYSVQHIQVTSQEDLHLLQGSKYVQSCIGDTYKDVKVALTKGITVLYAGTPCQISGLKSYLNKEYDNLFTIDIVCHGVSSDILLKNDIQYLLKKNGMLETGAVVRFRTKDKGWGTSGNIESNGKKIPFDSIHSPYYYYYLQSSIYRDSCYNCHYASEARVGDITLGDYWGVEKAHPDVESTIKTMDGVSCVLANTVKGQHLLDCISNNIHLIPSTLSKARERNGQLVHCCTKPQNRAHIFKLYKETEYVGVVKCWKKSERKARMKLRIKSWIPQPLKKLLKRI